MAVVFAALAPCVAGMWHMPSPRWHRSRGPFGGLYQVVIAERSEG
jgi:hypothetical protein